MVNNATHGDENVKGEAMSNKSHNKQNISLSRRNFFRQSFHKAVDAGVGVLEKRSELRAERWFRPPFAISELDFLLDCTRCGKCIDLCPHQVIFPLSIRLGADVAATPALDLTNKSCHLCNDWPCVTACESNALRFPEQGQPSTDNHALSLEGNMAEEELGCSIPIEKNTVFLPSDCPPLAKAEVNKSLCLPYSGPECGACRYSCPIENALQWHDNKPYIDDKRCVGCGLCREACIVESKAIDIATLSNQEKGQC